MTTRQEAERLLSQLNDDDIVEVDERGNIYRVGTSPQARIGKPIAGISDQKGEYYEGKPSRLN